MLALVMAQKGRRTVVTMESTKGVPGKVGILEKGMSCQRLSNGYKLRAPDVFRGAIHIQMAAFRDQPGQICLGQFPEIDSLADVLCSPGHIFAQVLVVVVHEYTAVEEISGSFLGPQDPQDVSRVLDGLRASEVESLDLQIRPACSAGPGEGATHDFGPGVEE